MKRKGKHDEQREEWEVNRASFGDEPFNQTRVGKDRSDNWGWGGDGRRKRSGSVRQGRRYIDRWNSQCVTVRYRKERKGGVMMFMTA